MQISNLNSWSYSSLIDCTFGYSCDAYNRVNRVDSKRSFDRAAVPSIINSSNNYIIFSIIKWTAGYKDEVISIYSVRSSSRNRALFDYKVRIAQIHTRSETI